jgi:hypothetical protein
MAVGAVADLEYLDPGADPLRKLDRTPPVRLSYK